MYFFSVLLWLLSDILFENTNITRASVPSDHLSLRKVNAIYIYMYIWKSVFAFILTIYFIPIFTPPLSRKIIFFLEDTNILFLFQKKERERKTILTISPIVLTHVSLND